MKAVIFVFLNTVLLLYTSSTPIESRCFASDTKCLTAKAQQNVAFFVQGIPDIHVERLDPMYIDYIKNEKEGLLFEGWNNQIEGLANAVMDEVSINMNSNVMRLAFHINNMVIKGKYKVDGLLFTMPICGQGEFVFVEKSKTIALTMPFDILVDAYHRSFMNLKNFTYNYETKDGARFLLTNLFYGDRAKSDYIHNYLNKNWKLVTQIFPPILLDDICFKIFNAVATFMRSRPLHDLLL